MPPYIAYPSLPMVPQITRILSNQPEQAPLITSPVVSSRSTVTSGSSSPSTQTCIQ